MCGIFGIVAQVGREPSLDDAQAARLRDLMTHRGPDGAGLWRDKNALLAHRRLAIVDPSLAGAQPMVSADGRFALVYNGELYNDAELRREIESRGEFAGGGFRGFRTRCDAETLLYALATWGLDALPMLRGMYAFALYDTQAATLTLVRDPLGIKPLYFHAGEHEMVFASEVKPILSHPLIAARPNLAMISAYLTTIRTALGNDTLFDGVLALAPGQVAQCHFGGSAPAVRLIDFWGGPSPEGAEGAAERVRAAVDDSVRRHLRADVPTCALLSGGLDSTIVATIARREAVQLRTYCAGAREAAGDDDFAFARLAAERLNTRHAEAVVSRGEFARQWPAMIGRLGTPLSTPNEVAIHAVASLLRADGCVVALSGEGADELFAGYEHPLLAALRFESARRGGESPGRFQVESNAWIPTSAKEALLAPGVWSAVAGDEWLVGWYEHEFARCAAECGAEQNDAARLPTAPLDARMSAHLKFQRRVNLVGLLQRLDTATMLASVEGRTPLADVEVARLAESLPMSAKFEPVLGAGQTLDSGGGAVAITARTKTVLRAAFADSVPREVLERPKASFPLPFQAWVADHGPTLRASQFARAIFDDAAIEMVAADPARHWRLSWPMINLAMWGDAWWGG